MAAKKTTTSDYLWGANIGEGAFARVVHARRKLAIGLKVEAAREEGGARQPAVVLSAEAGCPVDVKFEDGSTASLPAHRVFTEQLAVKIMEKMHIMKNDKVS